MLPTAIPYCLQHDHVNFGAGPPTTQSHTGPFYILQQLIQNALIVSVYHGMSPDRSKQSGITDTDGLDEALHTHLQSQLGRKRCNCEEVTLYTIVLHDRLQM